MMTRMAGLGIFIPQVKDISEIVLSMREFGYKFICSDVMTPEMTNTFIKERMGNSLEQHGDGQPIFRTFSWPDVALKADEWKRGVVGGISDLSKYLQEANLNPSGRRAALELLKIQIDYCQHLGLAAILFELNSSDFFLLAREIKGKFDYTLTPGSSAAWIKLKLGTSDEEMEEFSEDSKPMDSWNIWNKFRTVCQFNGWVYPVLELQENTPDESDVARWLGERVRALFIPTKVFSSNSKNYPVLSPRHQHIVKQFMNAGVQILIQAKEFEPNMKYHAQYIAYLWTSVEEIRTEYEKMAAAAAGGYFDVLQTPLQPLQDNLQSYTYEVFEGDAQKYTLYENAISAALVDMVSEEDKPSRVVVLMVLGAGRGPIVKAALRAGIKSDRKLKVYALEKNYNAVNTLIHLLNTEWQDKVTVVHADMRTWNPPEQADIIVSELLGSFGDNEVSPECLDGAERYLKEDGLMIPQSYTSHLGPVMSPKLHCEAGSLAHTYNEIQMSHETPYVVCMMNKYDIDEPKPLFTFFHPNRMPLETKTNERFKALKFTSSQDCLLTGFAGYFECVLYKDVRMSIHPSTHTENMMSWFPMYFPLKDPVYCSKNDTIQVDFARKTESTRVWYEWTVLNPGVTHVHNYNGKSSSIGLQ